MTRWIVEPPDKTGSLIDDSYRVVELDDSGNFNRVICKLHKSISSDAAAVFACVVDMYIALKSIKRTSDHAENISDDSDDEATYNDMLLFSIAEKVDEILEMIDKKRQTDNKA